MSLAKKLIEEMNTEIDRRSGESGQFVALPLPLSTREEAIIEVLAARIEKLEVAVMASHAITAVQFLHLTGETTDAVISDEVYDRLADRLEKFLKDVEVEKS